MVKVVLVFVLTLALCFTITPVSAVLPGGGLEVLFQCTDVLSSSSRNANDATVYVDDVSKGTMVNGLFAIPYESGFSSYRISKSGYNEKSGMIPDPAPGQTTDIIIDATLTPSPSGSGKGWINVHSNVDGASVAFDGVTKGAISSGIFTLEVATSGTPYTRYTVNKGTITDGILTVQVYSTGTPYKTYRVEKGT